MLKVFYERNDLGYVDPQSGLTDITVSLDGTWSHRGFSAIIGVGFVMDVYGERAIDAEVTAKCIHPDCKDQDVYLSPCPRGRFHGSSSDMERHNALVLFRRSKDFGFRYTTYVMDGDCKIVEELNRERVYGDTLILKNECANHMVKRGYNGVYGLGHFWTRDQSSVR